MARWVVCGDALAAVAVSSAAMAQVTISGRLDVAAINNGKITTQADATSANITTKTSATGAQSAWTTAQIVFSGSEDLGGGLTAGFTIQSGLAGNAAMDRDRFLTLRGGFGTVALGRLVPNAAMGYHGFTGAATVNSAGSVYGIAHSSSSASVSGLHLGNAADAHTAGGFERNDNQIQYTSPAFSGVTVNVNYGTSDSDKSDKAGKQDTTQQGISITYAAGPLRIAAATNQRNADAEGANNITIGNKIKGDLDWIGASYNLGVATVSAAQITRKDVTTVAAGTSTINSDIKATTFGVSVPMGKITLNASMYTGSNNRSAAANDNFDLSGHQLSARYAFSKRTTAYAVMGENKTKRVGTNNIGTSKFSNVAAGLMHTF